MKAIIFANAHIDDYSFVKEYIDNYDFVICCDGGIKHTYALNIIPDFIIGDFDSSDKDKLSFYKDNKIPFIPFPVEKDYTDMELCINFAINRNAKEIIVFGGIGSRFDHTLANVHILLQALKKGVKALLINENNLIQIIDREVVLSGEKGQLLSLIPLTTDVKGVTTEGMQYPLNNETLSIGSSRGVSNVFIGETATIKIRYGFLIVVQTFE